MKKLFAVIASLFLLACSSKGIQPMSVTDEHLEISDNVYSVAESVFQESSGTEARL